LGKEEGMTSTKDLIIRAMVAPNRKVSERLKDNRLMTVVVSKVDHIPGLKNHTKAFFYIDGKRIARATAALILRKQT
jgi:hypothetical protein